MRYLSNLKGVSVRGLQVAHENPHVLFFNPSVAVLKDRIISSFRASNIERCDRTGGYFLTPPDKKISNDIVIGELNEDFTVARQVQVDLEDKKSGTSFSPNGFEDLRIVVSVDGAIEGMSCIPCSDYFTKPDGELILGADFVTQMVRLQFSPEFEITKLTNYDSPFQRVKEKNWSPFYVDGKLCVIYQWNPLIILELLPDGATRILKWFEFSDELKGVRGGSQGIETKNGYLFVVHRREAFGGRLRFVHRLIELGRDLQPLRSSEEFGLISTSLIEYCAGVALFKNRYLLSFGLNDCMPLMMEIEEECLDRLLVPCATPVVENTVALTASAQAATILANAEFPQGEPLTPAQRLKSRIKEQRMRFLGR